MHRLIVLPAILFLAGCYSEPTQCSAESVLQGVDSRFQLNALSSEAQIIPQDFSTEKPLQEDHAVLLALWNNPAFQDAMIDLKLTRADLIQAGLLPNPEVVYYFNVTDKPFKYLVDFPIESLWLRPIRMKVASAENIRVQERLTQLALDLIRDTRQAFADLQLARERVRIAEDAVKLRGRIAEFAETRLKAGDVSQQDAALARIDALQAKQDVIRLQVDITLTEERLKNLMGLSNMTSPLINAKPAFVYPETVQVELLVKEASETRPDLRAADVALQAAEERSRLARTSWFRFLGIFDATSGKNGHEPGPAFRMTIPLFNLNQGAVARAEAEQEQLEQRRNAIRNQIITDVRQAAARFSQSNAELTSLLSKVFPEVQAAIKRSEQAVLAGNAPYLIVLETTRQLFDTYNREVQLVAERQRAWADLERSVGRRLSPASVPVATDKAP
jgi:cobalt-zinc-cadmium efflux system outer membrane protein